MPSPLFDGMGDSMLLTFGEAKDAIFKPQTGGTQTVEVIFNARHQEVDRDGKPFGSPKPRAWFRTGTFCPEDGDFIEIDGVDYLIREEKPDGLELSELLLVEP